MADLREKVEEVRTAEKSWRTAFKTFFRKFDPAWIAAIGLFLICMIVVVAVIYWS